MLRLDLIALCLTLGACGSSDSGKSGDGTKTIKLENVGLKVDVPPGARVSSTDLGTGNLITGVPAERGSDTGSGIPAASHPRSATPMSLFEPPRQTKSLIPGNVLMALVVQKRLDMRGSILMLLVTLAIHLSSSRIADACSIIDDRADPPNLELPHDAAKSPAAPLVVEAHINHSHGAAFACPGGSCGDIHGLSLDVEVDASTYMLRIDFPDRPTIYARLWNTSGGAAHIFLPGFEDESSLPMAIRAINEQGYLSLPTPATAYSDGEHDGCSASGPHFSWLLVLLAALLVSRRRRSA